MYASAFLMSARCESASSAGARSAAHPNRKATTKTRMASILTRYRLRGSPQGLVALPQSVHLLQRHIERQAPEVIHALSGSSGYWQAVGSINRAADQTQRVRISEACHKATSRSCGWITDWRQTRRMINAAESASIIRRRATCHRCGVTVQRGYQRDPFRDPSYIRASDSLKLPRMF
jgi:hypothetical protein